MKDVCELCSLCSPNMGCTKLKNESCLKEAIKLIKPSVTNGELITRIINPDSEDCAGIEGKDGIVTFQVTQDAWDRKRSET